MLNVSCRELRAPRQCDPGDLRIAYVDGPPCLLTNRCQCCSLGCSNSVKIEDAILEVDLY